MSDDYSLADELLALIGEEAFFRLVEEHAGIRLYVPSNPERSGLPEIIGQEAAVALASAFPGGYIRVPLAREFRVMRYVKAGWSNRDMAQRLGLTESGVEKLLKRSRKTRKISRPERGTPKQLKLF